LVSFDQDGIETLSHQREQSRPLRRIAIIVRMEWRRPADLALIRYLVNDRRETAAISRPKTAGMERLQSI
jgi:hypothetical protein